MREFRFIDFPGGATGRVMTSDGGEVSGAFSLRWNQSPCGQKFPFAHQVFGCLSCQSAEVSQSSLYVVCVLSDPVYYRSLGVSALRLSRGVDSFCTSMSCGDVMFPAAARPMVQ